jgi:GNAT superfamily N-acetyltransferase
VEEVAGGRARDEFVRFQLEHYQGDPLFVPPIVAERREFIDPAANPFFQSARASTFLARRAGRVVGRIAAVVDERYNRFHGTRDGFVGMFESQNDPGLAAALFEAATQWLRRQGLTRVIGPVSLGFHHEVGVLVDGFDQPPAMMMPYNPRFYGQLFEANGFHKLKDLWTYEVRAEIGIPPKVRRLAERVRASGHVRLRPLDTARPEADIRRIKAIFTTMLRPGFGFAPMSDAEFMYTVNRLRPLIVLRPELSIIAEVDGEMVGFAITVPDTHQAQKAAQGYLFPFGLAKMLWQARSIERVRGLLFGIKEGWRRRGIDALLAAESFDQALALGYRAGELGWVMEDDKLVNRMLQATGATRSKTYRVYARPL